MEMDHYRALIELNQEPPFPWHFAAEMSRPRSFRIIKVFSRQSFKYNSFCQVPDGIITCEEQIRFMEPYLVSDIISKLQFNCRKWYPIKEDFYNRFMQIYAIKSAQIYHIS